MKIKKILVLVDSSAIALARLETAFNMVKLYGASVTCLYAISVRAPMIASGGIHGGWYLGDELLASSRAEALKAAAEVRTVCERLAKQYETKLEWIQEEGEGVTVANNEARFYDIVLLGAPNAVNEPQINSSEINGILLGCGKPCLVIPGSDPVMKMSPRNVVFAWDGSREATQALMMSISFLINANSVMVVTVHDEKEGPESVCMMNHRITRYLIDHEVAASSHLLNKKGKTTAQILIDYTIESESDLLVMGAYGHSRLRELVLGGATNDMLQATSIPVIFGH